MYKSLIGSVISVVILVIIAGILFLVRPTTQSPATQSSSGSYAWKVSNFATNLAVPWDMVFLPSGDMLITERAGKVKLRATAGTVTTIATLPQVVEQGESGLTGVALHPNFAQNNLLYLYYSYANASSLANRVSQFTLKDNKLSNEKIIIDALPGGAIHNGGRLAFGPDNKLWVLTGDAGTGELSQKLESLGGKVLRANDDGTVPGDNPFPGSLVYSLGHRNPQGLDWHPVTGELVVTSHGQSAYDEVNLVTPKSNHGWPTEQKCQEKTSFIAPIFCSNEETWAPSGATFYGTSIPEFTNAYFFAGLRGNLVKRIDIVNGKITHDETIIKGSYGRLRGLIVGPDGNLYVSTSNRDGRGIPSSSDDKILKLTPIQK